MFSYIVLISFYFYDHANIKYTRMFVAQLHTCQRATSIIYITIINIQAAACHNATS